MQCKILVLRNRAWFVFIVVIVWFLLLLIKTRARTHYVRLYVTATSCCFLITSHFTSHFLNAVDASLLVMNLNKSLLK